jgi:glycosyltransferase involved in cell wall biosynthesis
LEFVRDGINGFVVEPDPAEIAGAIGRVDADRALARSLGESGRALAQTITWDAVINQLVSHG